MYALSPEERQAYQDVGLIQPDYRFDEASTAGYRALLDATLADTSDQRPESIVCPHIASISGLPAEISEQWLALCTRPEILDMVEELIGPDIVLWGSQMFCKPAGTGIAVPWHQDGHFWPIRPLATCSAWIAIDAVDPENGAMQYVPGSHRHGTVLPHVDEPSDQQALNAKVSADHLDVTTAASNDLPAGGFSLHDVFLVHGSAPNRSSRRRAGYAVRYMPATSHYDRSLARNGSNLVNVRLADRPLYLLRGQDHTGKTNMIDLRR